MSKQLCRRVWGFAIACGLMVGCGGKGESASPSPVAGAAGEVNGGGESQGGQGDGGAGGAACGVHDSALGRASVVTIGPRNAPEEVYQGPATVERSTLEELILDFPVSSDGTELRRVSWQSAAGMPQFPVGAQVWLDKSPAGPLQYVVYRPSPGFAISLKTAKDGRVLIGAAFNAIGSGLPSFSAVDDDACVERYSSCRESYDKSVTYQSVKVEADEPVVIGDSQTATIQLDGAVYDAYATSRLVESGDCASDYFPPDGISLELRAQDLSELVAQLEIGELPSSCNQGNDPSGDVSFFTSGVVPNPFEGKIVFRNVGEVVNDSRSLLFDFVDLEGATDTTNFVFRAPVDSVAAPEPGTEFWVSFGGGLMALRQSEQGKLIAVTGDVDALGVPASATQLEQWLGVAVTAEKGCAYANGNTRGEPATISLSELSFATEPAVRAMTGKRTLLELDGATYEVWVSTRAWHGYSVPDSFAIVSR